jgi:DNA-directed RNA polymerase subunit L
MIDEIKYIAYSIHQNTIMFSSLKEKDNSIEFEIKNISKSIVNAIRRTCLSNIRNTAFDEVNFKVNTTSLHDEFLKHRIELIPVLLERFDEKKISNYTFKLHVTNKPNEPTYVTTNDIEVFEVIDGIEKKVVFKNMFIQEPNPILITRFPTIIDDKEIQELNVEFKLRVGTGIIHTKYSPTTICVSIPQKDKNDETNNDTYKFKLESVGLVSPAEIVTKSFVSIGELLNTMQKDLSDNNIQINTVENFRGIEFVFEKQSATTGYMIQEMMYELFYNKEISHVSYHETHPLENTLAFRIKLIETDTDSYMESDDYINATKKLMTDSLDKLLESLSDIVKNWKDYKN